MKKSIFVSSCIAVSLALMLSITPVAQATMILTLSDGAGHSYSATSSGGSVNYVGSVGNFNFNYTNGFSNPILGNANNAMMDLLSLNVSASGGGTLTITLTDDNFTMPSLLQIPNNSIASMNIGGTLIPGDLNSISYSAFLNNSLIGNLGAFTTSDFSGSTSGLITATNPFLLTQVVTITSGGNLTTSFDASVNVAPVPEPGTILLLGSGLLGIFSFGRRRKKS